MFPFGGAVAWTTPPAADTMLHPTTRCDWLKPCVTAPGRTSTTSPMLGACGVLMVKFAPYAMLAAAVVMAGRGWKKYGGRYRSCGVVGPFGSPPTMTLPSGRRIAAEW